ncbi:hypothetical protein [Streptomyces sanglieri]|uniref:hypothetical protein n=1 Tax=Streptomyces sanglieri TaxID=193460 RepID=UPI003526B06E
MTIPTAVIPARADEEHQPIACESTWRDAAWLPSGLLHTVAVPQGVTGHEARLGE